mgnify:FL=1
MNKLCQLFLIVILLGSGMAQAQSALTGAELIKSRFSLIDHHSQPVTEKTYFGKYAMIFFGFTHCPTICPLGLSTMTSALNGLGEKSEQITPLFISIDPERDTPKQLASYVSRYDPRLIGLTGSQEQIDQATQAFRAYYGKIKGETKEAYSFDHSAVIYLMDRKGNYVAHFDSAQGSDKISAQINNILKD